MTLPSDVDCRNAEIYVCQFYMTKDCQETCAYAHDIRGVGIGAMTEGVNERIAKRKTKEEKEMIIEITEQAKIDARKYQDHIRGKGITDEGNYTGLSEQDRWYFGYLGEWAFNEFLKINDAKKVIEWQRDANGFADDGDFFFDAKIIDVKTATKPFHKNLMMPDAQFQRTRKDFYVAVRLTGDDAEILGFATTKDFEDAGIKNFGYVSTRAILFTKLRPIDELLSQQILKKWEQKCQD